MSKKRPTKKPKPTPRVYINVRYSIPLGMRLTKSFKAYTADAVTHAMSNYKVSVFLDTGEDLEEFELTFDGVEVRR